MASLARPSVCVRHHSFTSLTSPDNPPPYYPPSLPASLFFVQPTSSVCSGSLVDPPSFCVTASSTWPGRQLRMHDFTTPRKALFLSRPTSKLYSDMTYVILNGHEPEYNTFYAKVVSNLKSYDLHISKQTEEKTLKKIPPSANLSQSAQNWDRNNQG
ncbi:unnamed protein product [Spirodela intermedia]|uniref:Uncharacterized protein n=1 Tax=Spirodela intermedia TaxID=51605 RepID=A0A7I8KC05_SPIIN|nr:unnamed protein product [Spirodela intermedia]